MIMGSVKMLFLKHFHTQFSADKNDFENVESVTSTCIYKERRAIYIYFHTEIIHGMIYNYQEGKIALIISLASV